MEINKREREKRWEEAAGVQHPQKSQRIFPRAPAAQVWVGTCEQSGWKEVKSAVQA